MKVSYVIPVYNAQTSLPHLVKNLFKLDTSVNAEFIFIDDASTDQSKTRLMSYAKKDKRIRPIFFEKNKGQHIALLTGITNASGDIIVCLDDDLQTPPEEINKLIKPLISNQADAVYGQYETNEDLVRIFGTKLNNLMALLLFKKPKDVILTSFFAINRETAQKIASFEGSRVYLPALVLRSTERIVGVAVKHQQRPFGKSGYTFGKLIKLWATGILLFIKRF